MINIKNIFDLTINNSNKKVEIVCDKCGADTETKTKKIKNSYITYIECKKCKETYIGLIENKQTRAVRKDKDKFIRLQKDLRRKYKELI